MPEAELRDLLEVSRGRRVRFLQRPARRLPHRGAADRTRLSAVARAARTRRHGQRHRPDAARGRRAPRRRGVRRRDAVGPAPRRGRRTVASRRLRPTARGRCDRGGAQLVGRRQSTRSDRSGRRSTTPTRRTAASSFACSRGPLRPGRARVRGAAQMCRAADKLIDDQNLERQLFEDPETVSELLQRYLPGRGLPRRGGRSRRGPNSRAPLRASSCRFVRVRASLSAT